MPRGTRPRLPSGTARTAAAPLAPEGPCGRYDGVPPVAEHPDPPRALPGARTSCALLTVGTVLLAWPWGGESWAVVVRPFYFALLYWFFRRTARAYPQLAGQPMRLVGAGFLVLWVSFTLAAALHFLGLEPLDPAVAYLRRTCESGALFLLATTLIAYGLMLWIPTVLESHRVLDSANERQRSELRQAESARTQLERQLVDADRRGMLGELAASIAHDLRNPLTIVKGTAESLCRRARTPRDVAEHTEVIRRNVEKADRTIASLIDLGRPRASLPEPLLATEVLREVLDLVHVEARRRRVSVELRSAAGDDAVCTDRVLLAQALLNLVLNAVQACDAHGHVVLRAVRRCLGGREHVALVVEDRGRGLPPDWRTRLFTPFFTTKEEGTGLGLTSGRRIAGELGGTLGVYPRRAGGARALLLLPAAAHIAASHAGVPACTSPAC